MAGRGRGRGGRGLSFSVEGLGIGRGEILSGPVLQPLAVFPPLEFKPVPLLSDSEHNYLLELKKEYRSTMKDSQYFTKLPEQKRDIERYSDKYQLSGQDHSTAKEPDWSRLPRELRPKAKRRKIATVQPNLTSSRPNIKTEPVDMHKAFEDLEKKEAGEGVQEEGEEEEKEEEEDDIEDDFFEDDEDDNDYNLNYFDNGEGYGADEDDDLDEGPLF